MGTAELVVMGTPEEQIATLVADLKERERSKVLKETELFYEARRQGGMAYLSMGEHLSNVREVLEPLEKWGAFVGTLPNMGQATAYRMIWAWENAQKALPAATRAVAAREGYKLISWRKGAAFAPGYDKAVKAVTREIGPAPEKDEEKAAQWLVAVKAKKRELAKRSGGRRGEPTIVQRVDRVVQLVEDQIAALEEDDRKAFADRLLGEILEICSPKKKRVAAIRKAA